MKIISVAVLLSVALAFSAAEDDGQYHPELNDGDDGQYHPESDAKYLVGKRAAIYSAYQPTTYTQALQRELLAPFVKYGDSVDPEPFPSSLSTVTYSPFSSTYRPVVYTTPRPTVYSTPSSVVYSTSSPLVYSTPSPAVYSTPSPIVYSTPSPIVYSSTARPIVYSSGSPIVYNSGKSANIIRQDTDVGPDSFQYFYASDDGTSAGQKGDSSSGGTRVTGFYEYVGPDGVTYRVDYTADENGFRPVGRHLPVAPVAK